LICDQKCALLQYHVKACEIKIHETRLLRKVQVAMASPYLHEISTRQTFDIYAQSGKLESKLQHLMSLDVTHMCEICLIDRILIFIRKYTQFSAYSLMIDLTGLCLLFSSKLTLTVR